MRKGEEEREGRRRVKEVGGKGVRGVIEKGTTISKNSGLSYQQLGSHALGVGPAVRLISTTMNIEWKVGLSVQNFFWTLEIGFKLAPCKPFNMTYQNGQERRPCRCTEIVLKLGFTQKPYIRVRSVSLSVRNVSP